MKILFTFFIIITLVDFFSRKLFSHQEEDEKEGEQIAEPSYEVLKKDKKRIYQYLKTQKYQLTLSIAFSKQEFTSVTKERIYLVHFKTERNENGKASVIIDNNGNISLKNLKIFEYYRASKSKRKTYDQLLAENVKYEKKIKEVQKIMRNLL